MLDECNADEEVHDKQHKSLQPIRFAVGDDEVDDEHRHEDDRSLEDMKIEPCSNHRMRFVRNFGGSSELRHSSLGEGNKNWTPSSL